MSKIIEAKAVISAEDRTGKVLDGIARKFKDVGKGAKVSAEIERMNRSLAQTEKGLRSIERINAAQAKVDAAKLSRTGSQAEVARIKTSLDQARKAENGKAVADLTAQQRAAERAVAAANISIQRQVRVVAEARHELNQMGVPVTNLVAHERALRQSHDATTASVQKLARAERERERFATARAANAQRRYGAGSAHARTQGQDPAGGGGSGIGSALGAGAVARFGVAAAGIGGGAYVVGDGIRRAAKSSMDFERTMIEVAKATDASGPQLDTYAEKLLALARATGKTKEDLGSMLSSAGFAGRPKEELMDFTEYAAKATVAWQTGAEDTGQALAEIGNIYQANQKRIEEIGDAINTMADNSASKETDLLEFMRRAGASSKGVGIAAEEMLAFGAAMKEVGVRNETAGTAFEAMLNVMKLGKEFSKKAGEGLKELGVNSTKMRKDFVAKPVETMVGLLEKLQKVADPLKKAEIMTNLFGKEYQDDVEKLLNQLPKINEYLGIMRDKSKIASGGVRSQFAQNLGKDVSKIDRATQAMDVLMKRVGDPIKVVAGGVADQINSWVEKLEYGDTVAQRLLKRLSGGDGKDKKDGKPGDADEGDPIGRAVTSAIRTVDPKFGRTRAEQEQIDAEDGVVDRAERAKDTLGRPAEIEARIRKQRGVVDEARAATGMRRSLLTEQAKGAQAEIARLEGDLAKAWEAIGGLRVQQKRDGGAFGADGPTAAAQAGIGKSNFGLGPNGTDAPQLPLPSQRVPLPPARPPGMPGTVHTPTPPPRPPELGGTLAPKADGSAVDGLGEKMDAVKTKAGEVNALVIAPAVNGSNLGTIVQQLQQIIALAAQANSATAGITAPTLRGRSSSPSFSDGVTPGAGGT